MPTYKQISIPCKCYVRKYIERMYGAPPKVNNNTLIGIYVYALLEKDLYDKRNKPFGGSFIHSFYNDKLRLAVSDWAFFRIGYDLEPQKILAINRLMEELLEEHLFLWCDAYVRGGKERKAAIFDFCDHYGIDIEIDISYESLKKSIYRLRKKREQLAQQGNTLF